MTTPDTKSLVDVVAAEVARRLAAEYQLRTARTPNDRPCTGCGMCAQKCTNEVKAVMGEPQMVDQNPSETIWYYRTGTAGVVNPTGGVPDQSARAGRGNDVDFTPLVFNEQQRLMAWGKDVVLP